MELTLNDIQRLKEIQKVLIQIALKSEVPENIRLFFAYIAAELGLTLYNFAKKGIVKSTQGG